MIHRFSLLERLLLNADVIPHPFGDAASSVGLGFALGVAARLGITRVLSIELQEVGAIATSCGASEEGVALVLDCLEALGYVRRSGARYAFSRRGARHLAPDSPATLHHFILFCDFLYKGYVDLAETIRLGKRPGPGMLASMSEREWELYSRAMMELSRTNLKEVASSVPVPRNAKRLLDLGGSHGQYSIELCRRNPGLTARVMDLAPVAQYAAECITRERAGKQVSFLEGDFMVGALPADQDVVLAFNIIHGLSGPENQQLATKVHRALRPGGVFVVLDQIRGLGGASQMSRATTSYMALNLFHQAGGRTYTFDEVRAWALHAGFATARLKPLRAPGFGLVICTRDDRPISAQARSS